MLTKRCSQNSQTVRYLYTTHLKRPIELTEVKIDVNKRKLQDMDLEMQIKRKTLRKLELEIQKLEREVTSVHTVTMTVTQCINHHNFFSPKLQADK